MSTPQQPNCGQHSMVEKLLLAWPPTAWSDVHVVLAVSGGADSVAMLRAMVHAKTIAGGAGELIVGHLNHRLRPGAAENEADWLAKLCRRLSVECEIEAVAESLAGSASSGVEEFARLARYDFLSRLAERRGARYVVTAHTANDQVETVLHRLIRGTGLAGLAGIAISRALTPTISLVRPFLGVWRSEIESYLQSLSQPYCTDSSNADTAFTRNRIRHDLLDHLRREFNPEVDKAILRLASQASEAGAIIASRAEQLYGDLVQLVDENRIEIHSTELASEPPIIVRETCKLAWTRAGWALQPMGLAEWERLASLASKSPQRTSENLPEGVRAALRGAKLILTRN